MADKSLDPGRAETVDAGPRGGPNGTADGTLEPGDMVDHYQIRRLVGEGGMGRVYVAIDQQLGRRVALKVIRPKYLRRAGGPTTRIQRFLDEARTTAQFNHPHIVTVHGVGEHGGVPYVALEFLDGESLGDRMRARLLATSEMLRCAAAIADALTEAHGRGILHRDLKPDNVMIPSDGRVRVVDFGLAKAVGPLPEGHVPTRTAPPTAPGAVVGTPAYMAPELWEGHEATPASDMWAFGLVAYEMLTGTHPLVQWSMTVPELVARLRQAGPLALTRPDGPVPEPAWALIERCLAMEPTRRPTAGAARETLRSAMKSPTAGGYGDSPFRGLNAFRPEDSALFFGRTREVDAIVERLDDVGMLAVVGPSGAGKSSLASAGVLPRLLDRGGWVCLEVRPGASPFEALLRALRAAGVSATPELGLRLASEPERVIPVLLELAAAQEARVLLVVDQLEELFTHVPDPVVRQRFLDLLFAAARDPLEPIRVLLTLRDDFLGRLAEGAGSRELPAVTVVRTPGPAALREILVRPVEFVGYRWEDPAIVDRMIGEVAGEDGALPLLQFTCEWLWDRRDVERRTLPVSHFDALGGVAGALAEHARDVLTALSPSELAIARTLLLRLVTAAGTRRIRPESQALEGLGDEGPDVLERLRDSRLVSSRRAEDGPAGDAELELIHESLITRWAQLARWVEASRDELAIARQIESAAELWVRRGRPEQEVWRGEALDDALRRIEPTSPQLNEPARTFIEAGRTAELRRRRARRILVGVGLVGLVGVTIGALIAASAFRSKEQEAQDQRRRAEDQAVRIGLAAADMGSFELRVRTFDWDPTTGAVDAAPGALPGLELTFYDPDPTDPRSPGAPTPPDQVRVGTHRMTGGHLRAVTEARAGPAFLQVAGRGRAGQVCGPAWIPLRWLPGYAERRDPPAPLEVAVPTCAATLAGTVAVPGGPFIRGGPGTPRSGKPAFIDPEERSHLGSFRLDSTEVTNAAYRALAARPAITGVTMPSYPKVAPLKTGDRPDHPVAYVDWYEARAFCRFMGKQLPTSLQWEKAARGGESLDVAGRRKNPRPRRNLPWVGGPSEPGRANLAGTADGYAGTAPVGSFPRGASPYGILDLAGNVWEWTASKPPQPERGGMRVIRGGGFEAEPADELHTIAFENVRNRRYLSFDTGFRCATDPEKEGPP